MAETTAESSATFKPVDFIDQIYDQTNAACSRSIAFGLFDVRLGGALDFGWLLQQVECFGVKEQELSSSLTADSSRHGQTRRTFVDSSSIRPNKSRHSKAYRSSTVMVLRSCSTSCRAGMQTLSSLSKFLLTTILIPPRNQTGQAPSLEGRFCVAGEHDRAKQSPHGEFAGLDGDRHVQFAQRRRSHRTDRSKLDMLEQPYVE